MKKILPVILSGGYGTRLWPLSRKHAPKQFLKEIGSLFEKSLILVSDENFLPPLIISNENHKFFILDALNNLKIKYSQIILEPESKNTSIAVFLSALAAQKMYQEEVTLIVIPCDQLISDKNLFLQSVKNGFSFSDKYIVTFGVKPTFPSTGYGYIEAGETLQKGYTVKSFKEKPDIQTAEKLFRKKEFFWSCGIFLFTTDTICSIASSEINFKIAKESLEKAYIVDKIITLPSAIFSNANNISIDYLILEKNITRLRVVPMLSLWNDIGDFRSIMSTREVDVNNNSVPKNAELIDTFNTMIISEKLVAGIGLNNLIIVDTKDALLISEASRVQDIKKIAEKISEFPETLFSSKVYRPWGHYEVLTEAKGYKVKRIFLNPNSSLSLQSHNKRSEHWVVCEGEGSIIKGEEQFILKVGDSIYIKAEEKHRLSNFTDVPVIIIEVQIGSYLGEDDIIRYNDIY